MALYMLQAKYTLDAIRQIAESGDNREEAVRPLIEQNGGKLIAYYGMMGQDYHVAMITEFDSLPNYMGILLTGVLGGALADFKTILLYTAGDVVEASEVYKANKATYAAPGS